MRYYITRQRGMATLLVVFVISIILGAAIISATKVVLINRSAANDNNLHKPLLALAEGALVIYQGRIYDQSKSNDEYNLIYTGGGDCANNVKITAETYTNNTIECTDSDITGLQTVRHSDANGNITLYYKGKIERVKYSNSYNGRDKTDHDPTYKITATAYTDSGRGLAVTVSKKVVVHRLVSPIPVPLMTAHGFFISSDTTTTALSGDTSFRDVREGDLSYYYTKNVKLNLIYPDPNNDRPVASWVYNDATVQDMKNENRIKNDNAVIDVCYANTAPIRLRPALRVTPYNRRLINNQHLYTCSSADKKKLYDHTISREQISGSSTIPTGRTDLTAFKAKYPLLGEQYGDGDVLSYVFGGMTNAEDLSSTDFKFGNIDRAQRDINNTITRECLVATHNYADNTNINLRRKPDMYWIGGDKQQDCSMRTFIGSEDNPVLLIIKNTSLMLDNVTIYGVVVIIQDEQALVTAEDASTALTRPPYKDLAVVQYAIIYGALVTDIQVPSDTYGSVFGDPYIGEEKKPTYKRRDKGLVVENFVRFPISNIKKTLSIIYAPDIINTLRDKTIYTSIVPGSWTDNNEHLPH